MAHKYLNEIGISSDDFCIFNTNGSNDNRMERFKQQREEYGFDERETWSMDYTHATWLYSHLKMFRDMCCIELDYHKFVIPTLKDLEPSEVVIPEGFSAPICYTKIIEEEHTQGEAIDLMIEYLEKYLVGDSGKEFSFENEHRGYECLQCAIQIYAKICGSMWW